MSDIFLSYSRSDQARVAHVAEGLEASGRSVWWDRRLAAGGDYALEIERQIDAAPCVVVAWSHAARDSLWVRAEANAALDAGKIVQIAYDAPRLPMPFTMLHFLDFTGWSGSPQAMPWPRLEEVVGDRLGGGETPDYLRRGYPMHVAKLMGRDPPLEGLAGLAVLGWLALALAIVVALAVLLVAAGLIGSDLFAILSLTALAGSAGLLAACAFKVLKIARASRR